MPGGRRQSAGIWPLAHSVERVASARAILAGLQALGLDAEAIRSAAGIDADRLRIIDGALPYGALAGLWREAFRRAPREELPTEIGLAVPMGAFGVLDILGGASRDVASAIRAAAEHIGWLADGVRIDCQWDPTEGRLSIHHARDHLAFPRLREIFDEFILAAFTGRFSQHVGQGFLVQEVRLTRPAPLHPTRHQALLGAPVLFGCLLGELVIPGPAGELPVPTANALLAKAFREMSPGKLAAERERSLESAIHAQLGALLRNGTESAGAVARSLGMSERSLHRRLHSLGLRYRDVLARFREAEAERLLTMEGSQLSQIAAQLGFHDQSALVRAFKRWKGVPPGRWRRASSSG